LVSPDKIGLGLTIFVAIETRDHSAAWMTRFADAVTAMPEVLDVYRMAGDVDYMLRVVVADMAAYEAFYKRLIASAPMKKVRSRVVTRPMKYTTAHPIPAP
jgi:Lrp/AsnC family transcriptional regulator